MKPRLAAQIAEAGHELAVHGWDHRYLPLRGPLATYEDLARTVEIITTATGRVPDKFRPPYGVLSTAAILAARRLGLTPVLWGCWGKEWTPGATAHSVGETLARGTAGRGHRAAARLGLHVAGRVGDGGARRAADAAARSATGRRLRSGRWPSTRWLASRSLDRPGATLASGADTRPRNGGTILPPPPPMRYILVCEQHVANPR